MRGKRMRVPQTTEEFEREVKKPKLLHLDTGMYYWIWGWEKNRRILWGPYYDEESAYRMGYEHLDTDFTVVALRTKDEAAASRQMRSMLLEETSNVAQSFRRFRHKIGENESGGNGR